MKIFSDIFDDYAFFDNFWQMPSFSWRRKGIWVNPDRYDIVPKAEVKKELIEMIEKQIFELEEKKKSLTDEVNKLKSG